VRGGTTGFFGEGRRPARRGRTRARAWLSYLLLIRDSLFWSFGGAFVRIEDAYTRVDLRTNLTFKF
jgi:hypothetical protein